MSFRVEQLQSSATVEALLTAFTDHLRQTGQPDFSLLERCPPGQKKELLSLCNVSVLAYRALASERQKFQARKTTTINGLSLPT